MLWITEYSSAPESASFATEPWRVSTTYLKSTINSNIKFRASGDRIIPYQELALPQLDERSIVEVFIGSRNKTPRYVIEHLLKNNGFENVDVRLSNISYQ